MVTVDMLKSTLENMQINRAVIIDDQVHFDPGKISDILNGHYDEADFDIREFVSTLGLSIDELKTTEEYPSLFITKIKEQFPNMLHSQIRELIILVSEVLGEGNLELHDRVPEDLDIDSNTILFLDYKLAGSLITSEQLANLLAQKSTTDKNPRSIVFISNDDYFILDGVRYRMLDYKLRTDYFRKLREKHESKNYKNTVYDYISKKSLATAAASNAELYKVLQNLYGSKKFFQLLNCIEDILFSSSVAVLGQFHLLNARSIQEMIKEKVTEEGISAPAFLTQWISRHIAKKVEKNEAFGREIDRIISEINKWTHSYYEIHEDVALRDILLSEMWDTTVNERHLPVDFGDIFEIDYNNDRRRAILLTQTCTLAVRNNGKRSGRVAMLALENEEKKGRDSGITIEDWNGEEITFDLDETVSMPISFLDITTLNSDGSAILSWDTGATPFNTPSNAIWSDGYIKMMRELVNDMGLKLIRTNKSMYQIDETFMPFTNDNSHQSYKYIFTLKRWHRLDQQYALFIFQTAQAWWGRIGLPVNINFMDDYQEIEGRINAHGSEYLVKAYIKRRVNDIVDVGISIDELTRVIKTIYEDDAAYIEELQPLMTRPELAHLHLASGNKILSLKLNKNGINVLATNNIYVKLTNEYPCNIDIRVGKITRFLLEGDEITSSIVEYGTDLIGNVRIKVLESLLEEKDLLKHVERIEYKVADHQLGKVVSLNSRQDKIFEYVIEKNIMMLKISDQFLHQETAVAEES
ncbi:hypothetical protein WMW72_23450 [Paenibacillus filicis]|uniref:Uncharacterized protein n=1 Tax=Paenibacillus filicis TaxID=669464 RepID=A0ABU9DPR7_9BACL